MSRKSFREDNLYHAIKSDVFAQLKIYLDKDNYLYLTRKFGTGEKFIKSICLLAVWFNQSFKTSIDLRQYYYNLGYANLQAWIAYTIYDYLRDGKIPKYRVAKLLSVANILSQQSFGLFKSMYPLVDKIFNLIDTYYLQYKKRDSISSQIHKLPNKSIGITIVPIIVLTLRNVSTKNPVYLYTYEFFKYYSTARLLSDDLDDVFIDVKNKTPTLVTKLLQKDNNYTKIHAKIRKEIEKNFSEAIKHLEKIKNFDHRQFREKYIRDC